MCHPPRVYQREWGKYCFKMKSSYIIEKETELYYSIRILHNLCKPLKRKKKEKEEIEEWTIIVNCKNETLRHSKTNRTILIYNFSVKNSYFYFLEICTHQWNQFDESKNKFHKTVFVAKQQLHSSSFRSHSCNNWLSQFFFFCRLKFVFAVIEWPGPPALQSICNIIILIITIRIYIWFFFFTIIFDHLYCVNFYSSNYPWMVSISYHFIFIFL